MEDYLEDTYMEQIENINSTFTRDNPVSWCILLSAFREKMNYDEIAYYEALIKKLQMKQKTIDEINMNKFADPISYANINHKHNESENHSIQVSLTNEYQKNT